MADRTCAPRGLRGKQQLADAAEFYGEMVNLDKVGPALLFLFTSKEPDDAELEAIILLSEDSPLSLSLAKSYPLQAWFSREQTGKEQGKTLSYSHTSRDMTASTAAQTPKNKALWCGRGHPVLDHP